MRIITSHSHEFIRTRMSINCSKCYEFVFVDKVSGVKRFIKKVCFVLGDYGISYSFSYWLTIFYNMSLLFIIGCIRCWYSLYIHSTVRLGDGGSAILRNPELMKNVQNEVKRNHWPQKGHSKGWFGQNALLKCSDQRDSSLPSSSSTVSSPRINSRCQNTRLWHCNWNTSFYQCMGNWKCWGDKHLGELPWVINITYRDTL